jgi:hypothetical protein
MAKKAKSSIRQHKRRTSAWRYYLALIFLGCFVATTSAWEWTDFLGGDGIGVGVSFQSDTLTMDQVREMRVRDIKRRLSRSHGYSADELGRILDKVELIQALSFEEHKEKQKHNEKVKRALVSRGIIGTIIAIVIVAGWPVWTHVYAVGSVNLVVYLDKRKYEASRCVELKSMQGIFGVLLMAICDLMSLWLTTSVFLSWFTTSRYFFPTPNLPIRPAAMMGGEASRGPMAGYGINIGPMALSWAMRFVNGRLEAFTGKALSKAYQRTKQEARQREDPEERAARKAARRAAKKAAKEEAEQKKREEEYVEAKRRKEAADKATEDLFAKRVPAEGDNEEDDDKEFRAQMDNMDMNDID